MTIDKIAYSNGAFVATASCICYAAFTNALTDDRAFDAMATAFDDNICECNDACADIAGWLDSVKYLDEAAFHEHTDDVCFDYERDATVNALLHAVNVRYTDGAVIDDVTLIIASIYRELLRIREYDKVFGMKHRYALQDFVLYNGAAMKHAIALCPDYTDIYDWYVAAVRGLK